VNLQCEAFSVQTPCLDSSQSHKCTCHDSPSPYLDTMALIYQSCETGVYFGVRLCLHSSHRLIYEDVRTFEIQVYAMLALDKSRGRKRLSLE